jgi:aryl-alcohol dehydrogenase-like predicted oxidoreductase
MMKQVQLGGLTVSAEGLGCMGMADAARELSVGLVAYSPLGRGFLAGTVDTAALAANEGHSDRKPS